MAMKKVSAAQGGTLVEMANAKSVGSARFEKALNDGRFARLLDQLTAEDEPVWRKLTDTSISVNLGASPKLPFNGGLIEQHTGTSWVTVERREDGLYVDNRKIVLHLSERQQGDKRVLGYKLRSELSGKPALNANVIDALFENTHLLPENWKKNERGEILFIYFWATIYRDPDTDDLYVRALCFDDGAWLRYYYWLDGDWYRQHPAALLAS